MKQPKKYRNEIKYIISKSEAEILKKRLSLILNKDKYAYNKDGSYIIKSLYFDDIDATSYYEKVNGVLFRKKYRIRTYNNNDNKIYLEKKMKDNNLTSKDKELISRDVYSKIIDGKIEKIECKKDTLLEEFLIETRLKKLIPSVIVSYKRTAFTYPISNIRITFDEDITSEGFNYNLFENNASHIKALEANVVVLEVKYDEILPDFIKDVIGTISFNREAISKFQRCKKVGGM